jgi:hypothetical protein
VGQLTATTRVTSNTSQSDAFSPWALLEPTATTITATWSNQTLDIGGNAALLGRLWQSSSPQGTSPSAVAVTSTFAALTSPHSENFAASLVTPGYYISAHFVSNTPGNQNSADVTLFSDLAYCPYGTELAAPGTFAAYLTPGLIDVALAAAGVPWAAPFLTAFWFTTKPIDLLCATFPPIGPALTLQDFIAPSQMESPQTLAAKIDNWFNGILWNYFCKCTPAPGGSPAPVKPPVLVQNPPAGAPTPITFACDDGDLCTLLNQLGQAIAGLQTNIQAIRSQVDFVQRQSVPDAYAYGTLHTGLSGAGTIAVTSILGLVVETTSMPGYLSSDLAPVASFFKLGEISIGTPDGWTARRIVTHNPHLFLQLGADVTIVAYLFEPGVTANIQELVRTP